MKNKVQRFGKFLSAMIMPNIGALIAFGFLAAFFNGRGWIPHEGFATIFSAILIYLIPVLIASTGGRLVGGDRGSIVGAIAVIGAIMSDPDTTMLMAAMIMGPLAGFCIKKFDEAIDGHMPAGFEMLINNFSAGIMGMLLAMFGFLAIGPFMNLILAILTAGVDFLVVRGLLPLIAVFIEPAKILFLNNAINQGIFTPIATSQAAEAGKCRMYMLEPPPGAGLGAVAASMSFRPAGTPTPSAPGAVIIHLLGGIHEIYFPYILMNPVIIVGPIVGNIAAIFWFTLTDCGLVGPASPGSIIAFFMMAPGSDMIKIIIGVLIAAGISFAISSVMLRTFKGKSLEEAQQEMAREKAKAKGLPLPAEVPAVKNSAGVKKVIFACDAGMGSSAMGATKFRNRIKAQRPDLTVKNTSVDNIPSDCDIAVVQVTLVDRAKKCAPNAQIITINNFLADPALDSLYEQLTAKEETDGRQAEETHEAAEGTKEAAPETAEKEENGEVKKEVMVREGIKLNLSPVSKEEAIQAAGELLAELGYVDASYIPAMQEREKLVTTYMGMGVAIPHGTSQAKGTVKKTGIVLLQYPEGVDFGDEKAQLVFGIAGIGDEHLDLLSKICGMLEDEEVLEKLKTTSDIDWVFENLK